ncbi:unnamed protein product [Rhizoctonia solani]|uniref:Terpene synthase n=1 Tax=Rhizoctonia solani TaxID=456999 RepID=A0A8H3HDE3_9AGAM|nr:unnamed protein product [Rhizoctonia solani]
MPPGSVSKANPMTLLPCLPPTKKEGHIPGKFQRSSLKWVSSTELERQLANIYELVISTKLPPQLVLPDVSSYTSKVFGLKFNPHHHEAEAQSYAWFDNYGVHGGLKREKFFESGFGLMTAMCYPDADLARLRLTMDLVLWLFAFDDMTDGGALDSVEGMKRAVDVTMKVLREPNSPAPNFKVAATIQDCFKRMHLDGTPAMLRRFVGSLDYYTEACFQQKVNRSVDSIPTIEEYIQLRRDTSAMKIAFAVLEYTLNLNLPDEVVNHPIVTELAIAGNDILTWANDIYSFPGFIDWTFVTPRYFGSEATKVKETGIVNLLTPMALDVPMAVEV